MSAAAPPQPSTEMEEFWPTIRNDILAGSANVFPMKAMCPICRNEVSIAGLPAPEESKIARLLPCGHILCRDCQRTTYRLMEIPTRCPSCRESLSCDTCGLRCLPQELPVAGRSANRILRVRPTRPEGAPWEERCHPCSVKANWLLHIQSQDNPSGLPQVDGAFASLAYQVVENKKISDMSAFGPRFVTYYFDQLNQYFEHGHSVADIDPVFMFFAGGLKHRGTCRSKGQFSRFFYANILNWGALAIAKRAWFFAELERVRITNPLWLGVGQLAEV